MSWRNSPSNRARTASTGSGASLLAKRRWQRWRGALWPLVGVLAAVGLAALAGWLLFASSWLSTQHVTVTGERVVSERRILAAAQIDFGVPLVRLDANGVRERVAALRPLESVSVHREWPNTVAITVSERQPVAVLPDDAGGWEQLDKSGLIFRRLSERPDLPVVRLTRDRNPATLHAAASVITSLPARLLASMRFLQARSLDSLTLHLRDGRVVRWGSAEQNTVKAKVLAVLLKSRAQVYDVSAPAQPTTAR